MRKWAMSTPGSTLESRSDSGGARGGTRLLQSDPPGPPCAAPPRSLSQTSCLTARYESAPGAFAAVALSLRVPLRQPQVMPVGVRDFEKLCYWCSRRDSNPHDLRHWFLRPACLPFHHASAVYVSYDCSKGSSTMKVDPWPGTLRIRTSPRWAWTIWEVI